MTDASTYFDTGSGSDAGGQGTWYDLNTGVKPFELVPGLVFRPVAGEKAMLNLVSFEPNVITPVHTHEEEQIAYVLEGELEFEVGDETRTLRPGMAVVIPANVPHSARTYDTRCLALDAFGPPRRGLLELIEATVQR
jgi:quercetin dioxygenase-like cupin family protein